MTVPSSSGKGRGEGGREQRLEEQTEWPEVWLSVPENHRLPL